MMRGKAQSGTERMVRHAPEVARTPGPASLVTRGAPEAASSPWAAWWAANRTALLQAGVLFVSVRVMLWLIAILATAHLPMQQGLRDDFHTTHNTGYSKQYGFALGKRVVEMEVFISVGKPTDVSVDFLPPKGGK